MIVQSMGVLQVASRAYSYDAKTYSCVGSHTMWSSYNGGKWYDALVY